MSTQSTTSETIRFPVSGMTCGSCVNRIIGAVRKLDGVTRVSVDLRHETVAAAGYEADLDAAVTLPPGSDRSFLDRLLGRS